MGILEAAGRKFGNGCPSDNSAKVDFVSTVKSYSRTHSHTNLLVLNRIKGTLVITLMKYYNVFLIMSSSAAYILPRSATFPSTANLSAYNE